jgi:hypothetical protein
MGRNETWTERIEGTDRTPLSRFGDSKIPSPSGEPRAARASAGVDPCEGMPTPGAGDASDSQHGRLSQLGGRTFPLACDVRMEDGSWQPGTIVRESGETRGKALIYWNGVTAWLYRQQGRGRPDEWRPAQPPSWGRSDL